MNSVDRYNRIIVANSVFADAFQIYIKDFFTKQLSSL